MMHDVCSRYEVPEDGATIVVDHYLEGEVLGKTTHGIDKFIFESQFFRDRQGSPEVVADTGPMVKLDGKKEIGPIAAAHCTDLVMRKADEFGIGIAGINRIQRYGILGTWAERMSDRGYLGIVMNTCEPAMAGFGSTQKALGTNPISFGIRQEEKTNIIDMACSTSAMSLIWQAKSEGKALPPDEFYNAGGELTQDPSEAAAVRCFGGIKGFSLALLVQTITGPVFGFKSAHEIEHFYDAGYVFLALNPEKTSSLDDYVSANTRVISQLELMGTAIPGARRLLVDREKVAQIELRAETVASLQELARPQ